MITSAKNPKFTNPENTLIDLVVTHSRFGEIPFSASANDSEPSGSDLHARALAGEFGPIAPYVAPVKPPEQIAAEARAAQLAADTLIVKTDPTVIAMLALAPAAQATAVDSLTTIIQLRGEVKRLAMVVNVLAKKLL